MTCQAKLVKDKFNNVQRKIDKLEQEQQNIIDIAIKSCNHSLEYICELPYQSNDWSNSNPPWLICMNCGLTEEGWGCGYKILQHAEYQDVPTISRNIWSQTRSRSIFQDGSIIE